jgi:hypothetical protein
MFHDVYSELPANLREQLGESNGKSCGAPHETVRSPVEAAVRAAG